MLTRSDKTANRVVLYRERESVSFQGIRFQSEISFCDHHSDDHAALQAEWHGVGAGVPAE